MRKLFLFDLDGTLTDPQEGITKCVEYALNSFGIKVDDRKQLNVFIGPPLLESFAKYFNLSNEKGKQAVEKYRERFSTIGLFENVPYENIDKLLNNLKLNGNMLAVATSKPTIYSKRILEKFDLSKFFDIIVGSELDGKRIDKAEVIEEVFSLLNFNDRKNAYMIGDRKHDIIGGKKCGIKTIGVEYGYAENNELDEAGADYIVASVDELTELLTKEI